MIRIIGILESSVIKQKTRSYRKSLSKLKSSPWHLAGDTQYFSSRCAACMCMHFKSIANWHTVSLFTLLLPILREDWCCSQSCFVQEKCNGKFSYQKNYFHQFNTFHWLVLLLASIIFNLLRTNSNLPFQTMFNRKFKPLIAEKWRI